MSDIPQSGGIDPAVGKVIEDHLVDRVAERVTGYVVATVEARLASLDGRFAAMDSKIEAKLSVPPSPPRAGFFDGLNTFLKGYRTIIAAGVLTVTPVAVEYFGNVDWQRLGLSPAAAVVIGGIIVVLRAMSTTPIGSSAPVVNKDGGS